MYNWMDSAKFQSGGMNIEMPFQDGRKLFHHSYISSGFRIKMDMVVEPPQNLHSDWFQSRPLNGNSFSGLDWNHSECRF